MQTRLVHAYGPLVSGSKRTVAFARKHRRPCLVIDMRMAQHQAVGAIVDWLRLECPVGDGILNVAGNRESKSPGVQQTVMNCMVDVIRTVNHRIGVPFGE